MVEQRFNLTGFTLLHPYGVEELKKCRCCTSTKLDYANGVYCTPCIDAIREAKTKFNRGGFSDAADCLCHGTSLRDHKKGNEYISVKNAEYRRDYAKVPMGQCPHCKGSGKLLLFTSIVDCDCK